MESGMIVSSELKQDWALSSEGIERSNMLCQNLDGRGGSSKPLSSNKDCSSADAGGCRVWRRRSSTNLYLWISCVGWIGGNGNVGEAVPASTLNCLHIQWHSDTLMVQPDLKPLFSRSKKHWILCPYLHDIHTVVDKIDQQGKCDLCLFMNNANNFEHWRSTPLQFKFETPPPNVIEIDDGVKACHVGGTVWLFFSGAERPWWDRVFWGWRRP